LSKNESIAIYFYNCALAKTVSLYLRKDCCNISHLLQTQYETILASTHLLPGPFQVVTVHHRVSWTAEKSKIKLTSKCILPPFSGSTVLCLKIWRKGNSGPWIHAMHFGFAIGAMIAPVIISPFLSPSGFSSYPKENKTLLEQNNLNLHSKTLQKETGKSDTAIGSYYLMLGGIKLILSLGYILSATTKESVELLIVNNSEAAETEGKRKQTVNESKYIFATVILMGIFFFLYVGTEFTYGQLSTPFVVASDLNKSKIDGTHVTAIFWGTFASMRLVAIFTAIYWSPIILMGVSFIFSLLGAISLALYGNTSFTVLEVFISNGINNMYMCIFITFTTSDWHWSHGYWHGFHLCHWLALA